MKVPFVTIIFCWLVSNVTLSHSQILPIKPTRIISFTTDEGTDMDVDISPDGETLLFDLLGDLYSMPVNGGQATQLTRGLPLNSVPVWSPNGRKIAYFSDGSGELHLQVKDINRKSSRTLGFADKRLSNSSANGLYPIWTPDGNYVVVGSFIYGLTDNNISLPVKTLNPVGFSHDGRSFFYTNGNGFYCYDQENKISKQLFELQSDQDQIVAVSPNGRFLAIIKDSVQVKSLIIHDLESKAEHTLVPSIWMTYPDHRFAQRVAFSPDSKNIFIGYGGKIHSITVENGQDHIIPFSAHVKSDFGALSYHTFRVQQGRIPVRFTRSANLSPDRRHLIFTALGKIYQMDLSNRKSKKVAPQPFSQFQPIYSPNGEWVAYVSWCDTVGGFLWRVRAKGGQPEQLTPVPGHYQCPTWSPDGKFIAITKGEPQFGETYDPGMGNLELISVDGGQERLIADSVPVLNQLSFSANGQKIIYQPKKMKYNYSKTLFTKLASQDIDGRNFQVIAIGEDSHHFMWLQQPLISPDGRFIVYSSHEDLFLIPLTKLVEPVVISDSDRNVSLIRFSKGVDPHWEKGGKLLSWTYGHKFYEVAPEKILATGDKTLQKTATKVPPKNEDEDVAVNVIPDRVIDIKLSFVQSHGHGVLALRNVRIITMRGSKVIEHGTVVIRDGRFAAVGPVATIPIPKGAEMIDLKGKTLMPGLVDMHLHQHEHYNIFPQQYWTYLANLAYGVTTARDPSSSDDAFGYRELIESGKMLGPRLFGVGRAIGVGHGITLHSFSDAQTTVQKRLEMGATVVKQYLQPTRLQRQWLLLASQSAGLNMTNEGAFDILTDIGQLKDGSSGIEHNPDWGDVYKDVITLFARSGTFLTPTLQVRPENSGAAKYYFNYKYWHHPPQKLINFTPGDILKRITGVKSADTIRPELIPASIVDAKLRHAGGNVTLGSHGEYEDQGIGVHNELWALQMGGLTNMEALQAATIMGAKAIGIQKDVGSIEVGKIADLLILNKNPLDDIHNSREIKYVMKDGIMYNGDTLDEIWPATKKCPQWRISKAITNTKKKQ